MQKKKYVILTAVVVITLLTTSGSAIASTISNKNYLKFSSHSKNNLKGMKPGIGGSVAAINGASLIIAGKNGTTYTVDTTNAKITKGFGPNTETLALTDIKIGDKIGVIGTVSGTNIIAKNIIDGAGIMREKEINKQKNLHLAGTILDVSPYSFTINVKSFHNKESAASSTLTYTVDTTSSTSVTKDGKSASLGDFVTGQTVIVTGNIDNTAKTIAATKVNIITLRIRPGRSFNKPQRMNKNK